MKLLLILSLACCSLTARSQVRESLKTQPDNDLRKKMLLSHPELKLPPQLKKYSFNNTKQTGDPSVVQIPLTGKHVGNNGKGADIYSMQPYNMPCLVPDDTFATNMPGAGNSGKYKMEKTKTILQKPAEAQPNPAPDDLQRVQ